MKKALADEVATIINGSNFDEWYRLRDKYNGIFSEYGDGRHPESSFRHAKNYSKYFDLDKHLKYHLRFIRLLNLDEETGSKRVLDLGCGAGLFLYLCQYYGHSGVGLDISSDMYRQMAEILKVNWRAAPVLAYEPLPDDMQDFDIVSAIAVKFDRLDWGPQGSEPWDLPAWEFFLKDAAHRLKPGGCIFLKPNYAVHPTEDAPGIFFQDQRIEPFLKSIASEVTPDTGYVIPRDKVV
ncbi:MAG: class I SAM-dependent methyltransferase [Alphaproteobacteria bacterium]